MPKYIKRIINARKFKKKLPSTPVKEEVIEMVTKDITYVVDPIDAIPNASGAPTSFTYIRKRKTKNQ